MILFVSVGRRRLHETAPRKTEREIEREKEQKRKERKKEKNSVEKNPVQTSGQCVVSSAQTGRVIERQTQQQQQTSAIFISFFLFFFSTIRPSISLFLDQIVSPADFP